MKRFQGKVALITGGTSGIGAATALAFAREGASVVVAGRREAEGAKVVAEAQATGAKAIFVRTDITSEADIRALVERTVKEFGRLDVAFNNAGVESGGPLAEVTPEEYRRVFDTNVLGVILSMKHQAQAMLKSGGGSIINNASVLGVAGMGGVTVYTASKHAVIGLTRAAALEYAKAGIRVNAVSPGGVQTDMLDRFTGGKEGATALAAMHPMGRLGTPAEIAGAVLYLSAPEASFITGQNILIDGGFTAQ